MIMGLFSSEKKKSLEKGLELTKEEVIDISVLSKELEVKPGEDVKFTLLPAKTVGGQPIVTGDIKSNLSLDEKLFEITSTDKYVINIPFNIDSKVNFQTDLDYVHENFDAVAFTMRLDTISFTSEITVDTTGYGKLKSTGWLAVSVNTTSIALKLVPITATFSPSGIPDSKFFAGHGEGK